VSEVVISHAAPPARRRDALAARGLGWMRRQFVEPERPLVAIEVRPSSVGVLRVRREKGRLQVAAAAVMELAPGTLSLSLTQPNLTEPARFRQALSGALERAGILGGARVALVLPDTTARVTLVPVVEVRAKASEMDELLRFRLRKSVPFEVRDARLAYVTAGGTAADTIVVATACGPVVAQYEEVCRSLGLEPGLVEIGGLALVRAAFPPASAEGDGLLVNWDEGYVTLVLARNGWPVLLRTLSGAGAATLAEVTREVSSTLIYYRERLGGSGIATALVRSAAHPAEEAAEALAPVVGFTPRVLDAWRTLGGAPPEASQGLAAAAASLGAAP
jgi:type IV pilus assembly protein PilM